MGNFGVVDGLKESEKTGIFVITLDMTAIYDCGDSSDRLLIFDREKGLTFIFFIKRAIGIIDERFLFASERLNPKRIIFIQ